ncbi:helix-turn-helix transcriptional regulator [Pigmentiphaga aceris]|uniref:Helix-turn-helix transcriptional regulator n=1 Tax=Pigmentiphaga aceris TaxID=1940612 RepID=A0A5C0AZ20_9BURK|nr:helix-turn-helix transcriptional regulator [Pigmentiphaga aceris]QEI07679.1 helix-turn-helix transcriptional regulator [Pigmentiphaga aceris]
MRRVVPLPFPSDPLVQNAADFGAAIRAARTASSMTIADAALLVGVSKQTLADLETARASVGLATAINVARAFGVGVFIAAPEDREIVRRQLLSERTS